MKSSMVMFRWTGTGSSRSMGGMSKCGTAKGSRGGMPRSGIPAGMAALSSSRIWARYSSTAGSPRAMGCPRATKVEMKSKILILLSLQ